MTTQPKADGDDARLGGLALLVTMLLTEQIASKAARDALFLISFDPRRLPLVMIGGGVFSFLAVLATRRAHTRLSPRVVLTGMLVLSGLLFALESVIAFTHPRHAAVVLYVHVSGFGALLVSSFWTMVSERWDPHRAKKNVARLAAYAALGGVLGGGLAQLAPFVGGGQMLLPILSVGTLVTAAVTYRVGNGSSQRAPDVLPSPPLRKLARWSYLWGLAGLAALVAVWQALVDFGFKAVVDATLTDETSLVRFFGAFYMATSLLTFAVQTIAGRFALSRAGVSGTAAATPILVTLGALAVVGVSFPFVVLLRGGEMLLSNSLLRSSYEVFFNPVPNGVVRASKTLVDVAATRVGDVVGSLVVLLLVVLGTGPEVPLVVAACVAGCALLLIPLVTRGYVRALTALLHRGVTSDQPLEALDRTTRRALEAPSHDLASIAAVDEIVWESQPERAPKLAATVANLESASVPTVRRTLSTLSDPALMRVVLPLLTRNEVRHEAMDALARLAPRGTGTLLDALLDPATPPAVRARIPKLFLRAEPQRAALGLHAGLDDEQLEVRLQCARGLAHLAGAADGAVDRDRILRAIDAEIAASGASWATLGPEPHDVEDESSTLDEELHRNQIHRSLRYALILVSILIDAHELELALRGLGSPDPAVRGTAFELLANVLPEPVREPLLLGLDPEHRLSLVPRTSPAPAAPPPRSLVPRLA